ncbi:hypothetical protein LAWI1_G000823 [Lachnellula willkommii]|uniref:Glycosyl transferase n=1 Tax=Lachnellula willkommii TaxID=215461 RepID=A0A559MMP0_9HELO|nr:hypothetical protein LAWI1_G000823 [Lachnellula willkommii]
MVDTYILPIDAGSGSQLFDHWWQWLLVGVALASITIGSTYIVFTLLKKCYQHFSTRKQASNILPAKVASHLHKYTVSRSQLTLEKSDNLKPKSLGIYLGHFDDMMSANQAQIFSDKDAIIIDPLGRNVVAALAQRPHDQHKTQSIIGRLDIGELLHMPVRTKQPEDLLISGIDQLMTIIATRFQDQEGRSNGFTGVLLAGYETISNKVLHALSEALSIFDLEVYLETSAPEFLHDASILDSEAISGLVIRNCLILENGERRDCFGLEALRTTLKAFVSQACLRDFTVLIWDTFGDDVVPSNAVLKRTFSWCSFYSAVPWIGSHSALVDASTEAVSFEPLSAFDWLKEPRVMKLHDQWKSKRAVQYSDQHHCINEQLGNLLPILKNDELVSLCIHNDLTAIPGATASGLGDPDWFILGDAALGDPLCVSATGCSSLDGLGCFPLGVDVTEDDFRDVVLSQRNLRKLELLDVVGASELRKYGEKLGRFIAETDFLAESMNLGVPSSSGRINNLAMELSQTLDDSCGNVQVFLGLHSGFQKMASKQFWAVYHQSQNSTDIYVSKSSHDILSVLLHAFLSSEGLTRDQCLAAEISFGRWQDTLVSPHDLPPRVMQDISMLTPDESILLSQRLSLAPESNHEEILRRIRSAISEALIDAPTLSQLKALNTTGYISGDINAEELWHCKSERSHPDMPAAMSLFQEVEKTILRALKTRNRSDLNAIVKALELSLQHSTLDAIGDIFAMSVFCTMRKAAFEEVYIEVTDRNPLFNDQPDQAAAFAELFALGSRCEAYFDVTPSQFGRLLSEKFRNYYGESGHQPPTIKDNSEALDSAYSEARMDVDQNQKPMGMPTYQRFTFLSVFAIPALIDILMLTTTGHGLYLSGKMSDQEQHSATVALMISLLLSGAIGTWITCGGTYYLASMAFSAMNYFVVTRLLGGFAFTLIAGSIGFIAFGCTSGFHAAIVFFLYLVALTTYLCLLAALANYQFTGSGFQSGRVIIIACIPVLFISPLVSMFVSHNDVAIYLTVIYIFILLLFLGVRRTGSRWTTWYQKIALIDDAALRSWHMDNLSPRERENTQKMTDPSVLKLARGSLQQSVSLELRKSSFAKSSNDPMVSKLVKSYESTIFLMDWYCRFTGVPKPIMFSSSWNNTAKVALDSLQKSQLGIRFHSGFIHWRQAGDEIGCTMLYFIVALLDKWVALIDGGQVLGLGSSSISLRIPVGFGLAYYLIGAVLLDFNATKLHELAGTGDEEIVSSDADIANALKIKLQNRRRLYWKTLSRYLLWHIWGLAVTSVLIWLFAKKKEESIYFLSYVGAYTDVVALAAATWTVAILSLFAGKIIGKPEHHIALITEGSYDAYSGPGIDQSWSQPELKGFYHQLEELPKADKVLVQPHSAFGHQVSQLLNGCADAKLTDLAQRAFPEAEHLLGLSGKLFNEGKVKINLISNEHFSKVVELLVQVTAEQYLGYKTRDALLAQTLVLNNGGWREDSGSPSVLERQLKINSKLGNAPELLYVLRKQLLKDLCLGIDPDIEWEALPSEMRHYLMNRCVGVSTSVPEEQRSIFVDRLNISSGVGLETHIARCNYAAFASAVSLARASSWVTRDFSSEAHELARVASLPVLPVIDLHENTATPPKYSTYEKLRMYTGILYHYLGTLCKFFSIAFVADPDYQREFHKRTDLAIAWKNIRGVKVTIKRRRVLIRNLDGVYTGFIHQIDNASFKLLQYRGDHTTEPSTKMDLCVVNIYSNTMTLQRRVEMSGGDTVNDYIYDYRNSDAAVQNRLSRTDLLNTPITRKGIAGKNALQSISYNSRGQIDSGSYLKDGNLIRFQYHYQKAPKHSGALLRAEFVLPHLSCTVSWCAPPRRKPEKLETWIPHSQVTEATFVVDRDVWESKYFYDHKFHPIIVTTLNGEPVDTPPLILYDHLDVLKRPKHVSILDDNPLYGFSTINFNPLTRFLGCSTRQYPVPTTQTRSWLWMAWKKDPTFDGVVVRWLDERLLRRDPILRPYWRKRDLGNLKAAEDYLDQNRDAVMASVDLDNSISSMTPLAIKINDLYSFGQGGDSVSRTRSNITTQEEDETQLHVIAVDTGTWPNEGGGVSACRSDVVNNLRTIKWHMVAESANDFGLPKRQIERNVHSLKIIPLWGLDLMTPTHGLFSNKLDSEVEHITTHATLLDIERAFVPILEAMVKGARAIELSVADIKQMTRALVNLNSYFKETKHWSETWRSEVVKAAWRRLWLSQTAPNARPSSEWLKTEHPTLGQLDQGLEIWSRYLFIFAIPLPDKMPAVFQASHHSVSASYGVVCKIKRGCTLQIWDHAISWRETNLYLSSALCPLSPFVRNSLLGLMRMTSVLTLHHADTILPCADFFNPNWEVEIGTYQGRIEHRAEFKRKIDPVVNGITDMQRFAPVKEIKTTIPTVTMLSHIQRYAKDIKTALLSADIIINKWGFRDFRLDIYGTIDKAPSYTTQCQEIIATKSLRHQVKLQGESDALSVLENTWVFLNSSVSEGLPLALGEAALTGAPVVCTDVGASLRVLTNPSDGSCYSAVVAPNDALAMARAQIKLLALLDEWAQYSDPAQETKDASFPEDPTPEDVARITKRMYEQQDARRALGMRTRAIVQKSFSGDRYLREHEQMLWIGKAKKDMAYPGTSVRPSTPEKLISKQIGISDTRTPSLVMPPPIHSKRASADDSVPSLAFENTSTMPSLMTDIVPSWASAIPTLGIGGSINKLPQPVFSVAGKGLRREMRTVNIVGVGDNIV